MYIKVTDDIQDDENIHNVSPSSPLGLQLIGKKLHEKIYIDCKDPYDLEILKIKKDF